MNVSQRQKEKEKDIYEGARILLDPLHLSSSHLEDVVPCSRLLRYICPTDESRMTTVPKPRSWEVKIYDKYC